MVIPVRASHTLWVDMVGHDIAVVCERLHGRADIRNSAPQSFGPSAFAIQRATGVRGILAGDVDLQCAVRQVGFVSAPGALFLGRSRIWICGWGNVDCGEAAWRFSYLRVLNLFCLVENWASNLSHVPRGFHGCGQLRVAFFSYQWCLT